MGSSSWMKSTDPWGFSVCAIVDEDAVAMIFGTNPQRPESAAKFFEHVDSGKLKLVLGGRLKKELLKSNQFKNWYSAAWKSGLTHNVPDEDVNCVEANLKQSESCKSNDTHVLALAKVSGARLLYTGDRKLMDDFRNKALIPNPKGKIYTTPKNGKFNAHHKQLLASYVCKP